MKEFVVHQISISVFLVLESKIMEENHQKCHILSFFDITFGVQHLKSVKTKGGGISGKKSLQPD